jgi:DNA-binding NtrC family response regulator
VEEADGGTLFLDELSSLPAAGQRKLLRVLETRRVRRLGDGNTRHIDFRLVAAAQGDLADKVRRGEFRLDLYQRVAGVVIDLPALSERANDIVLLAAHFARHLGLTLAREIRGLLVSRPWPGNVRELRTTIERAGHLATDGVIDAETLIQSLQLGPPDLNGVKSSEELHTARRKLLAVCERYDRNAERIAGALGIGRATLYRRLSELGIVLKRNGSNDLGPTTE